MNKICPLMSRPVGIKHEDGSPDIFMEFQNCMGSKCQFWIEVFTTELHRTQGCCYELQPQMVDGQLRV